jgi:hypothetical protein
METCTSWRPASARNAGWSKMSRNDLKKFIIHHLSFPSPPCPWLKFLLIRLHRINRPVKSDLAGPLPVSSPCLRASSAAGGESLLSESKTLRPLRLCEKHSGSYPCHPSHPWFSAPNPEPASVLIRLILSILYIHVKCFAPLSPGRQKCGTRGWAVGNKGTEMPGFSNNLTRCILRDAAGCSGPTRRS